MTTTTIATMLAALCEYFVIFVSPFLASGTSSMCPLAFFVLYPRQRLFSGEAGHLVIKEESVFPGTRPKMGKGMLRYVGEDTKVQVVGEDRDGILYKALCVTHGVCETAPGSMFFFK
jgi:hypothetical protein